MFLREDKRRSHDLKHRFTRKARDADNAECVAATYPAKAMKTREYTLKMNDIIDQWERSGKSNNSAVDFRAKLEPMVLPRDHAQFPVYRAALLLLVSR